MPDYCLQDTYVPDYDVNPYFQIASHYGFANFMFQTNEGPSFPAHMFLFSGTSAPTVNQVGDVDASWFVSGNSDPHDAGCTASIGEEAHDIKPSNGHESYAYDPPEITWGDAGYPCYNHSTMAEVLNNAGKTWRYYGWEAPNGNDRSIWNAPNAMYNLCVPSGPGKNNCTGDPFTHGNVTTTPGQVLADIDNCQLQQVSWVVPDGYWSDHPGSNSTLFGPFWVSSIVNKIGNSWAQSQGGSHCDYWGGHTTGSGNQPTLILITWDDWGGWYDHIAPYEVLTSGWGAQYVSSFRVPLLVVSAYTDEHTISGPNTNNPDCPNHTYCHDFGSLLKFTETNFSLSEVGDLDSLQYADHFAPDNKNGNVPLSEFFNLTSPRSFYAISLPPGSPDESYFTSNGGAAPDDEY